MNVSARFRRVVIERAGSRCEYCGLSQEGQEAEFHVDHIVPVSALGPTALDNLALACVSCSLRKGARRRALDAETGQEVDLFHPRQDRWSLHFRWDDERAVGLTATGRATISALGMNRPLALAIRREERFRGRHPLF
jgi:hypothetical protein